MGETKTYLRVKRGANRLELQSEAPRKRHQRLILASVIVVLVVLVLGAFAYYAFYGGPRATTADVQRTFAIIKLGVLTTMTDGSSSVNMTFLKCGITVDGAGVQIKAGAPFTWGSFGPDTFAVGDKLTLTLTAGQTSTLSNTGAYLWLRTHVSNPSCGDAAGTNAGEELDLPIPASDLMATK